MRLSLLPLVLMLMLLPAAAAAALDDQTAINQGFDISFGGEIKGIGENTQIISTIIKIINALLVIAAIAAIVFIIIAGFRMIVSGGDEDAFSQGKRGLLYAIIGLIVIILALAIVNFFTSNIV